MSYTNVPGDNMHDYYTPHPYTKRQKEGLHDYLVTGCLWTWWS